MKALVLAIVVVVACSGSKNKQGPEAAGSGSGSAIYAKKIAVSWGITSAGSSSEVFLQTTDETGKQVSHPVGTYEGTCQVIKPAEDMKALSGVNCTSGSSGIELHAVIDVPDIIVLKLKVEVGVTPDPMSREEVTRVTAPTGASIDPA
jgi:hypothetical protein